MPTIQHNAITNDSNLHEPKGISSATSGEVYQADGAGSGSWVPNPPGVDTATANQFYVADGSGGGDWKTMVFLGWEDVNHGGSSQSLTSGTRTKVLNDGAGTQTTSTYALPGNTGSVWNTTNNQFEWDTAGLQVGDTVDIRFDIEYTVDTNNDGFTLELDMAVGGTNPFTIPVDERNLDTAGTQEVVRFISVYIGSTDVLTNPAELYVTANSAGDSIDVQGWYVKMEPRSPRFV